MPVPDGTREKEAWYSAERRRFGAALGGAASAAYRDIHTWATDVAVSSQVLPVQAPVYYRTLSEVLLTHRELPTAQLSVETGLQVIRIGSTTLVGLPSEVYVEYGLEIKARLTGGQAMVLSYCNDYLADLITHQALQEGLRPELAWTKVHPDIGKRIMEASKEWLSPG